jgi:hypothetical protein
MAESLLVRKGGGGAKIDEALQSFTVASGETVTAGTFVEFIKNFSTTELTNQFPIEENTNYSVSEVIAEKIDENTIFVAYSFSQVSNSITGVRGHVIKLNNGVFSITNSHIFIGLSDTSPKTNLSLFNNGDNRLIIAFREVSENRIKYLCVVINRDDTFTWGGIVSSPNNNATYTGEYKIGLARINVENTLTNFLTTYINGSQQPVYLPINLSGTQIVFGTTNTPSNTILFVKLLHTEPNRVIAIYGRSSSPVLQAQVVTYNSGSGSYGFGALTDLYSVGTNFGITAIDALMYTKERGVIVFRNHARIPHARIFNVAQTTINAIGTPTALNSLNNTAKYKITRLKNNSFAVVYRNENTNDLILNEFKVNDTQIDVSSTTDLIFNDTTGQNWPAITSLNGEKCEVFFSGNLPRVRARIITPTGATLKNATTSDVNGLAKTSGTAGQTVEVFVNE